MEPITLTNPATGETWTSGKRGRKPLWVSDMIDATGTIVPTKQPKAAVPATPVVPGCLRVWQFVGQAGEDGADDPHQYKAGRCMIVAASPTDAIKVANPTFVYPLGGAELALMWKEVDRDLLADMHAGGIDVTKPAVWEGKNGKWIQRQNIHLTSSAV